MRARTAWALLLATVALMVAAPSAGAFIYWADSQGQWLGRAANDGSGVEPNFVKTETLPVMIAIDSAHIYWANEGSKSIGRANIDGSGADNSFFTGVVEPDGVAVTGSYLYWSTVGGQIGRANLDGSSPNPSFVTGAGEPCGLAVDSGHLYWVDESNGQPAYIGRAGLDGSIKELKYVTIPGVSFPCGVGVNSSNIFWADSGLFGGGTKIGRANTNTGMGADGSIIGDASTPCGIGLDATHLYWANTDTNTIGRANTDATGVNQSFIATGGNQVCDVKVDSLSLPPHPSAPPVQPAGPPVPAALDTTPPAATISKGPGKELADGVAQFSFKSSEAGSRFECKLDSKKPAACRSPKKYTGLKAAKHTFKVWAIDAAGNKSAKPAKRGFKVPQA